MGLEPTIMSPRQGDAIAAMRLIHNLVGEVGLEPTPLARLVPKTSAAPITPPAHNFCNTYSDSLVHVLLITNKARYYLHYTKTKFGKLHL